MRVSRRSGFTLIELMITLALTGLLMHSITTVVQSSVGLYRSSSEIMDLEARGSRAMQRIVQSLRGTRLNSIAALPTPPLSAADIQFTRYEGFSGVEAEVSDPIQLRMDGDELLWVESPLLPEERESGWVSGVPALFAGETLNNLDDNGNGYTDEPGLYFARDGVMVEVGLTLTDGDLVRTWTTHVTCRN